MIGRRCGVQMSAQVQCCKSCFAEDVKNSRGRSRRIFSLPALDSKRPAQLVSAYEMAIADITRRGATHRAQWRGSNLHLRWLGHNLQANWVRSINLSLPLPLPKRCFETSQRQPKKPIEGGFLRLIRRRSRPSDCFGGRPGSQGRRSRGSSWPRSRARERQKSTVLCSAVIGVNRVPVSDRQFARQATEVERTGSDQEQVPSGVANQGAIIGGKAGHGNCHIQFPGGQGGCRLRVIYAGRGCRTLRSRWWRDRLR